MKQEGPNYEKLSLRILFENEEVKARYTKVWESSGESSSIVILDTKTGKYWIASYWVAEWTNPNYETILRWFPAKKIVVEKWVADNGH